MRTCDLTRGDGARRLHRRPRRRLAGEAGSLLIETMVSALIVLIVGAGVMDMMNRGTEISAEQRQQATASNVAQSEQERLRARPVTSLSNLRDTAPDRTVNGVVFTTTSRTDWVDDATDDANCTSAAAGADYMKLTTTVTYPALGTRKPITLESLIAPPVRAFGPSQGSLKVQVDDRLGDPVQNLMLSLSGPATLSDATSDEGCVLWGYLAAGAGYTISASRANYVQPDGSLTIAAPAAVTGGQTTGVPLLYDQAGAIRATFTTKRSAVVAATPTYPQNAMVEHTLGFPAKPFPVAANGVFDSGSVLFPFASAYSIYAGGCTSAKPPPANLGSAISPTGATSATAAVVIPALNIRVLNNGVSVSNATVKVTSCTTTYTRSTDSQGYVTDPGFPHGTLAVCVANGVAGSPNVRKRVVASVANTTFPATAVTYDVGTAGSSLGACP